VILSETTRALVGNSLPDGVSVHTLGERRLKDIDEPERIFELDIEGAPTPEPPVTPAAPSDAAPGPPDPAAEDFGARLSRRIQEHVRRKIEEPLERILSDVDRLADRATKHPEAITEKLDAD
jgi:hypothetical protein